MRTSLFILGRQPKLGIAELESLYGAELVHPVGLNAAVVDIDPNDIHFGRIGGSIKLAFVLTELDFTAWQSLINYVSENLPKHLSYIPEGKLKLGISTFGLNTSAAQINKSGLEIKKIIKSNGKSVRIVPNKESSLNSAQVLRNQLTSPLGLELLFIKNGNSTILAQTLSEQDIDAYAARDQDRPKRDSVVGMLPPKLAQVLINLTGSKENILDTVILDPFCGTGVVLQEALLMGYGVYGTDIEPRMIDYSNDNLKWLKTRKKDIKEWKLEVADAMQVEWTAKFDKVVCETYLGRPLSSIPDSNTLKKIITDCNHIIKKFLLNIAYQIKPGTNLCIAVPAWKDSKEFQHLPLLDHLEDLGYTEASFVHVNNQDLIYFRENQIVARELLVLTRK